MRAVLLVLVVLLGGCTDLPALEPGTCGNGVVESEAGEACDGRAVSGGTCAEPGAAHECRYLCASTLECPPGEGCGLDGVCRGSARAWREEGVLLPGVAAELSVAEADGDGRADVWVDGNATLSIHHAIGTPESVVVNVPHPDAPLSTAVVTELSGDALSDAVIPAALGYVVALGNRDRAVRLKGYSSLAVPPDITELHAFGADALPGVPGDEVFVLAVLGGVSGILNVDVNTGTALPISVVPFGPGELSGPVRAGDLDERRPGSPCEEVVLAEVEATAVFVLSPCVVRDGSVALSTEAPPWSVSLADGVRVAGPVELQDLDGDGHLDLLVAARRGERHEVHVAFGSGDGTFHSSKARSADVNADGRFGVSLALGGEPLLALRDLDGDGIPDFVSPAGLHLTAGGAPVLVAPSGRARFTVARMGRFDGDALDDVVAGSSDGPGLSVFSSAGSGRFTQFDVVTDGNVTALEVGDLDGDRIWDFAAAIATPAGDALTVVFGAPFGAPRDVEEIGIFPRIRQLRSLNVGLGAPPVVDGAMELGALIEDEDGTRGFAMVIGQGNRALRAPFSMAQASTEASSLDGYELVRLAAGDVDGDGHGDVLSLGRSYTSGDVRLWSSRMYGAASVELSRATPSEPFTAELDWSRSLVGAVDLDGTPGDEMVFLGPRSDGRGHAAVVATAESVDGALRLRVGPLVELEDAFERSPAVPAMEAHSASNSGRLLGVDVDGDGLRDVVALGRSGDRGRVVVFYNDGTGALGPRALVDGGDDLDVRDFAVVRGETGERTTLLLLSDAGVHVVEASREGRILTVRPPSPPFDSGGRLLGAGDVDGDGVDDVVIGGVDALRVYLGVPTLP